MEYYNNLLQNIENSVEEDIPLCNIISKPEKEQNTFLDDSTLYNSANYYE